MKNLFRKTLLLALMAALAAASLPLAGALAAGADDPLPPQGETSNARLERIWARQLRLYERLGNGFERADDFVERVQSLIDKASANGKDVSAVQAALDAFEQALQDARPVYESAKSIVNSHAGFDENGKVTDPEKARETVQAMKDKLQEIKAARNGAGKALREAIKAFRDANPRPSETLPSSPTD